MSCVLTTLPPSLVKAIVFKIKIKSYLPSILNVSHDGSPAWSKYVR